VEALTEEQITQNDVKLPASVKADNHCTSYSMVLNNNQNTVTVETNTHTHNKETHKITVSLNTLTIHKTKDMKTPSSQ
jgi:hypothetical protein